MKWNNLTSDIMINSLSNAITKLECGSAIRLLANLMRGSSVYISDDCSEYVMNHVSSDRKEVGGVLLGRVFENNLSATHGNRLLIFILEAISSEVCRNSPVSLEMSTEIWNRVNEQLSDKKIVIGWYHSHPNIGAFFSSTDRKTQRSFFNHPYSLGWVIDPFRNESKVYVGMDSEEYQSALLVLKHELEV